MGIILPTSRTPDVLRELGERFRRTRLKQNLKLRDLARDAGVGLNTVRRLERGQSVGFEFVVRILRALGRLQALDAFLPEPGISPLSVAERGGKVRQRASGPRDG
jgi:putative transcriptional regulator